MITPCIGLCKLNSTTNKCEGCNRTAEEISNWYNYDSNKQMEIMKKLGYGVRMGREERLRRYDRG